jgi:hypothetical protein
MRIEAIFYWLGTILFVVGMGLAAGVSGYLIALGGAVMLFALNNRRQR